jgi:hypothetical protein
MKPVAIISDIHANRPALNAVLEDIDKQGIQELVCLRDIVGYGAQPPWQSSHGWQCERI